MLWKQRLTIPCKASKQVLASDDLRERTKTIVVTKDQVRAAMLSAPWTNSHIEHLLLAAKLRAGYL